MNAPAKAPTLEDLHKKRAALLKQESSLWDRRQRLAQVDRNADSAERALLGARAASSSEMENWQSGGCQGEMPGTSSTQLAKLQEDCLKTRYDQEASGSAQAQIEAEAAEIGELLYQSRIAVEDCVAHAMADHAVGMAARVNEIEDEKARLERELLGLRDYFIDRAADWHLVERTARASFYAVRDAAVDGLGGPTAAMALVAADMQMKLAAGRLFHDLCACRDDDRPTWPSVRKIIDRRGHHNFPEPYAAPPSPMVERGRAIEEIVARPIPKRRSA